MTLTGALFVTPTSACVTTVVVVVAALFPVFVSPLSETNVALFVMTLPAGAPLATAAVSTNAAEEPAAKLAQEQLSTPFVPGSGVVQMAAGPELCRSETNVALAENDSSSRTFCASSGPALDTLMVQLIIMPAVAVGGPVLVMARSAVATVSAVVLVLFSELGSLALLTVAVFWMTTPLPVPGATCATNVNVATDPTARLAIVHVFVAPVVQVNAGPLVCVNDTNVSLAGSESLSVSMEAGSGPEFRTVME
jgi:hypothetical protein